LGRARGISVFVAVRIVSELIVDGASRDAWLYQPVG
jgi:hypothetical protein